MEQEMKLKNSASPLAVDVITNGRDYMRKELVGPGQHELSWYQKAKIGEWEHKRRPLTDEEAVVMQAAFQNIIRDGEGALSDEVYTILGLERGQEMSLWQLTLIDKSKL
jgi:hypothetical protein